MRTVVNDTVIIQDNFSNFGWSIMTLMVLLSTENWPDVGRPAYAESPAYIIFFIVYLLVMILFVVSVPVSILFIGFKTELKKKFIRSLLRKRKCLKCAFDCLDGD